MNIRPVGAALRSERQTDGRIGMTVRRPLTCRKILMLIDDFLLFLQHVYKSEGRWFDSRWCHWNFS